MVYVGESAEFLAEMNMMLSNISDVDHTRIVKWMGNAYDYPKQYDIKRKGKDLEIIIKKMSSQEIGDLKYYLKSQNYINEGKSLLERISQEAVYIHSITGSGQDGAQNFIDDNNIDGSKLADYVRRHKDSKEKYDVRDIIAGTGVGANKSYVKRFLKPFLNESLNEEYDVSGVSRQDLKSILNYLDANDISYDFDGREEILSFDVTELDKSGQTQMKKWGLEESLDEREYSDEKRKDMAERGLALPDGSFPIKDLEDLKNAIQAYGRSKDQGAAAKFIAKRAKELSADDLIPDTEDFQNSLKESIDLEKLKVGNILNFSDGETWKITKIVGNPSNPRGVFAKPDGDTKKGYTSIALEFLMGELVNDVVWIDEGLIKEATTSWARLMKGVKSSETGPWSLVAIDNKKVIGQKIGIRTQEIIPAHYEAMRKEFPKAKIRVEDGTGAVVWTSN